MKTEQCPNPQRAEMQLSILNAPYFIFLSDNTTAELHRICEKCTSFKPTWLSQSKYS